jgi:hypothetical protein
VEREPDRISSATANAIAHELRQSEAARAGLWRGVRTELHLDDRQLVVFVEIEDIDPFEPSRLDRIFDIVEGVIVAHIPNEIPIREGGESWSVSVHTEGDFALIDGIHGGEKIASRTNRLSDGLGPPSR